MFGVPERANDGPEDILVPTLGERAFLVLARKWHDDMLQARQVLEFDEEAPYILAVPVFDEEAMRAVIGCIRGRLRKTSDEWLDETRGHLAERDQ